MKIILALVSAAALVAAAGAAVAADPSVAVQGSAESSCTLPDSWTPTNLSGGAASGQFSGATWTIPDTLFTDAASQSVNGPDVGLRVRGTGFCNAAHTFRLQSSRGGLVAGTPGAAAPAGFSRRRPVRYDAFWSTTTGQPFGPAINFTPTSAGQLSNTATYTISNTLAPPGNRGFDFRFILDRDSGSQAMIAGDYSDTVTITLTLNP